MKDYTNYLHWKSLYRLPKGEKVFPQLYWETTGMELTPGWKYPPLIGINGLGIHRACSQGFKSEIKIEEKLCPAGTTIPLLDKYRHVGAFLMLYGLRRGLRDLRWVQYTHSSLLGSETPFIAVIGDIGKRTDGFIVDDLVGLFKLINWYYCQNLAQSEAVQIVYIHSGGSSAMDTVRRCQFHFDKLVDLTNLRLFEKVEEMKNKENRYYLMKDFIYFSSSPLLVSTCRRELENYIMHLGQKL